jgi:hypothetical protein
MIEPAIVSSISAISTPGSNVGRMGWSCERGSLDRQLIGDGAAIVTLHFRVHQCQSRISCWVGLLTAISNVSGKVGEGEFRAAMFVMSTNQSCGT